MINTSLHILALVQTLQQVDIGGAAGITAGATNSTIGITSIGKVIEISAGLVLSIGSLAVLLFLIMGGFNWLTAGGDKGKIETARSMITNAIIGIAILASVFAIYGVVLKFVGVNTISVNGFGTGGGGGNGGGGGGGGGNCTVGQILNDGGAGKYCSQSGQNSSPYTPAMVKCFAAGQGPSAFPYSHYEPCSCVSGSKVTGYTFASC